MSKRKGSIELTSGVDKLEVFLQRYFKQIIIVVAVIIIAVVVAYAINTYYKSARVDKAEIVGEYEQKITSISAIDNYSKLSTSYDFLADYIHLTSGIAYVAFNDNKRALEELIQVTGNYEEIASGIIADLGGDVNYQKYIANSYMQPVWYYREILKSDKDKQTTLMLEFRNKYPDSKLLEMLESWGI